MSLEQIPENTTTDVPNAGPMQVNGGSTIGGPIMSEGAFLRLRETVDVLDDGMGDILGLNLLSYVA
jgi:hypothetical protein